MTTNIVTVSLPYPAASANRMWRHVEGKTLKSSTYRSWIKSALAETWGIRSVLGPYHLSITAERPDNRARDLDNLAKPISDLLQKAGLIQSDHLAQSIVMQWADVPPAAGARVHVCVRPA